MNKSLLIIFFISILFCSSASSQLLSPTFQLDGTLNEDTIAIFVGRTSISGIFNGFDMDFGIDNPLFEDIKIFPLLGKNIFKNIEKVTLIDIQLLNISLISNYSNFDGFNSFEFSDVDIVAEEGPFLFATGSGEIYVDSVIPFAFTSVTNFNFEDLGYKNFLISVATSDLDINFLGDSAYLIQQSNLNQIKIKDSNGDIIWSGNSSNYVFIIDDDDFNFYQDSSIHIFPLSSNKSYESTKINIKTTNFNYEMLSSIIKDISNSNLDFEGLAEISDKLDDFESILSPLSPIINGCMILVNANETFSVDNSDQKFSKVGFARSENFDVTFTSESKKPKIYGNYKLIFLGDHLFNTQAKDSKNGVSFPIIFILVWVVAIVLFILFRFYIDKIKHIFFIKEIDENRDEKIKIFTIIFHISALIIVFILLDREISYQFGVSAIDIILNQSISLLLLAFIIFEFVMWILGFFIFAIPFRIISNSILRMFGFGKRSKGIGKGIGAFGIWIFCAFYVKLIINIIFLFINPSSLLQM